MAREILTLGDKIQSPFFMGIPIYPKWRLDFAFDLVGRKVTVIRSRKKNLENTKRVLGF